MTVITTIIANSPMSASDVDSMLHSFSVSWKKTAPARPRGPELELVDTAVGDQPDLETLSQVLTRGCDGDHKKVDCLRTDSALRLALWCSDGHPDHA